MLISDEDFLKILSDKKISIGDIHDACHSLIPSIQTKDVPLPLYLQHITKEKYFLTIEDDNDIHIMLITEDSAENHPRPYVDTLRFLKRISN